MLTRLREWVRDLQARYGASERQICFALRLSRSSFWYRSVAADDSALRLHIHEITATRVNYGYRRVYVMFRREGWRDNHKRIYRLYREQSCHCTSNNPHRNKSTQRRQPQPQGLYPNHVWGMDFVYDALFDGRRLRLLTVIDLYTRECLGNCVRQNLRSTEVAEMLNSIALRHPLPQLLKTDNGLPFESTVFAHKNPANKSRMLWLMPRSTAGNYCNFVFFPVISDNYLNILFNI